MAEPSAPHAGPTVAPGPTTAAAGMSNAEWFARAEAVIPGGVSSPVRAFGSVGGTPPFLARGEGAYVTDVEGRTMIDLVQSYGAIIAGHAHPRITGAVQAAAAEGTSFGAPIEAEVQLCEAIVERIASVEMVRLVSSGTEATMSAVRVARAATGRDRVVKFAGNYHGHSDALLADAGSGVAQLGGGPGGRDSTGREPTGREPVGVPGSAGVSAAAVADTITVPYNRVPTIDDTVAAVIVEPVAANMSVVAPAEGFLEGLRAECDRVGAVLIFDEVITGFRLARGGAQEHYGVTPDLTCFGKVIGGGLNVGAYGGRADLMAEVAPLGPVYQAGTLSGNPLATAAGLAALSLLDHEAYATLADRGGRLACQLQGAFDAAGLTARVTRVGPLLGIHFGDEEPVDYETARRCDEAVYAAFFHQMLARGVAMAPGAYEAAFPGLAHDDDIIARVVDAAGGAAAAVASS